MFQGSHVVRALVEQGCRVRVADIAPERHMPHPVGVEVVIGNLCDRAFAYRVADGAHTVMHFAANMGGMGTIHGENGRVIYRDNHTMTMNIIDASHAAGVARFLYASSACVYPDFLQRNVGDADVSLQERDVWTGERPAPQGLYGMEKLNSELLLQNSQIDHPFEEGLLIARFHNVYVYDRAGRSYSFHSDSYGPGGAWGNGREKAPAAFLRKAFATKALTAYPAAESFFEVWGDGTQRRSFLFIDDCVDAIMLLVDTGYPEPINIGSDYSVSIKELAGIAFDIADVPSSQRRFCYKHEEPVGVASRNSNNSLVQQELRGWRPRVSLMEGMRKTGEWIAIQIQQALADSLVPSIVLQEMLTSQKVSLEADYTISFAVLLPITSRGGSDPSECLQNLTALATTLFDTTWRDTHAIGGQQYCVKIYLIIDEDDRFLLVPGSRSKPEDVLRQAGFSDVSTLLNHHHPKGHVCALWRDCAKAAYDDGCHYFVLLGDDIVLQDEGWMRRAHAAFANMAVTQNVPHGVGCVAFTDTSFPGMPTFPIIHRMHLDIFNGIVVPHSFIIKTAILSCFSYIVAGVALRCSSADFATCEAGEGDARYEKQHAVGWTLEPLDTAAATVQNWLDGDESTTRTKRRWAEQKLTLDVIIPSYRVDVETLGRILALEPSPTCTVMFIVIIDDPRSPAIAELQSRYGHRVDVRIRVNKTNMGASYSRNRGLGESAAEWVHFLDDDIVPNADLLVQDEKIIRAHPKAAGFVGNVQFPPADSIFTTAVHIAGVTFFWDIAGKKKDDVDVPWGVTASLIARRNNDGVEYDLTFPKTGGGEDIDYCRKKRGEALKKLSGDEKFEGFVAAPDAIVTHPWWNAGRRSYWRFYMWSKGDSALIAMYPEYRYRDAAPNAAEMLALASPLTAVGALVMLATGAPFILGVGVATIVSILFANILHDVYRHIWRDAENVARINTSLAGLPWFAAVVESTFIRIWSEVGRLVGLLERGEVHFLGCRFDWFTGSPAWGDGPIKNERTNSMQRLFLTALIAFGIFRGFSVMF